MATAANGKKAPQESPPEDNKSILFQWCEDQQARIVWGEYSNGHKFCRVRVGRQVESEGPDFVSAAQETRRRLERYSSPRSTYLRDKA